MPVIGRFVGGLDFSDLFVPLADAPAGVERTLAAYRTAGVPVFAYGAFVTVLFNFLILAWIVFLMVKAINAAKRKEAEVELGRIEGELKQKLLELRS